MNLTYTLNVDFKKLPKGMKGKWVVEPVESRDDIERLMNRFKREGHERKYAIEQATCRRLADFFEAHPDIEISQCADLASYFGFSIETYLVPVKW